MSGDRGGQSRPIDVTEDEIRELAGPRDTPVGAVSRLHELVPSGPSGELSSESDIPVGVDLKDIDALRQTQDRPERVLQRLTASDVQMEPRPNRARGQAAAPSVRPPSAASADGD
jgi:hypothetical protein